MIRGVWNHPFVLFLIGAVLLVIGLVLSWLARAARARRSRHTRAE